MSPTSAKILVVDDEFALRLTISEILTNDGHEVTTAEDGKTALNIIAKQTFDLALLDLNLGGKLTGIDVLTTLKEQSLGTIAIMLTAYASMETAVEALRQGAHDYLFKPCSTVELRESIRQALLKRQQTLQQQTLLHKLEQNLRETLTEIRTNPVEQTPQQIVESLTNMIKQGPDNSGRFLQGGGLILDFNRHVIILNGQLLKLTQTEFDLIAYLVDQAPQAITPKQLIYKALGFDCNHKEASAMVRAHVYHIRQKIKETTGRTDVIDTVRGIGYSINL